jgi:uncharacterized delta-60 repeat protein
LDSLSSRRRNWCPGPRPTCLAEPLEGRLLFAAGDLDRTFGNRTGVTPLDLPGSAQDRGNAIAVQADGKYVVAGTAQPSFGAGPVFAVARFNSDGSPDAGFGDGGRVTVSVAPAGDTAISAGAVAIAPDGRIVVAGSARPTTTTANTDFALVRLNGDGSLDTTFDGDGRLLIDFSDAPSPLSSDTASAVTVSADGRITVAGTANRGQTRSAAVARLNADGSLDPTFGAGGKATAGLYDTRDLAIDSQGRIVLAGGVFDFGHLSLGVARLAADGSPDATFGANGVSSTSFSDGDDLATAVALALGDRPVVAGYARSTTTLTSPRDVIAARFNADGSLDPTFDVDGKVTLGTAADDRAYGVVVRDGGGLAIAFGAEATSSGAQSVGDSSVPAGARLQLLGLDPSGTPDSAFGTGGVASGGPGIARAVAPGPNGSLFAAGSGPDLGGEDFVLERFTPAGAPDAAFAAAGRATADFLLSSSNLGRAVAAQPDGKVIVGGSTWAGAGHSFDFLLLRYNADGKPDLNFGDAGRVIADVGGRANEINAIALQSDGRIVAAGYVVTPGTAGVGAGADHEDFAVLRYNADGSPDATFGAGGLVRLDGFGAGPGPAAGSNERANALVLLNDGRILVVGGPNLGGGVAVARLNPDGSPDATFGGGDGMVFTATDPRDFGSAVALAPDGKFVATAAAQLFSRPIREGTFTVLRYDAAGNLDPTFGGDGVVATRLSPTLNFAEFAIARAVAVWPDGRIVAGGTLSNGEGEAFSFGLARYLPDGTLDRSFGGGDGWLRTFFNVDGVSVRSLIPLSNGGVLAAGDFAAATTSGARPTPAWPMALYGPDGGLNPFFGSGGVVLAPVGGTATSIIAGIKSAALTADGNIVAAGFLTAPGQAENVGVARFLGPIATDSVAPRVVSAVSRKGSSFAFRDLPLSLDALGRGTVEPRLGGPTEIVLTLSEPVRAEDGFIDATEVTVTGATVGLPVRFGPNNEISVRLSRVTDRATITVALHGLRDSAGNSLASPLTIKVRGLYGDADQNGRVDALDLAKIARARMSPPSSVAALIADLDQDGRVDARDLLVVRRNLGHAL